MNNGNYFQCPYCPKAFLNGSFLQAHVHRRHELHDQGGGSDMYCAALKEAGASVEDRYRSVETELSGIRERLQATEVELREEKSLVASLLYNVSRSPAKNVTFDVCFRCCF